MNILIETIYVISRQEYQNHASKKLILAGDYNHVRVLVDGIEVRKYGNYAERGEEKAAAFADGIMFAPSYVSKIKVEYKSTIME
jgi:hypothetical protein